MEMHQLKILVYIYFGNTTPLPPLGYIWWSKGRRQLQYANKVQNSLKTQSEKTLPAKGTLIK
jgi:hypothetical protein